MFSVGVRARFRGGKGVKGASRLRVRSCNIGTLTGKSIKLVKILKKRRINIAYIQKPKWVGTKAQDVGSYKLWYSGGSTNRNVAGIIVDRELRDKMKRLGRSTIE